MSSTISAVDVSALIKQFDAIQLKNFEDDAARKALSDAARRLAFAVETPGDTVQRIAFTLETSVATVASDLGLFEIFAGRAQSTLSTDELADITRAEYALLGRVLRYLASFGMIREISADLWSASNITRTLSLSGNRAGLHHHQDCHMPAYQKLPEFPAETRFEYPSDSANSALQKNHETTVPAFVWVQDKSTYRDNFARWIGASHEGKPVFLDVFPFVQELGSHLPPETPMFVDIGCGLGHQCVMLKKRLPNIPGRVVLQDLPAVIAHAPPIEGVELLVHDFWTEQPIKGARVYYMRNILHDHPDKKCLVILDRIVKAMSTDSVILIDDMIIPIDGANWRATQLDLTMMTSLAGVERTERQWYDLMDTADLRIEKIYNYTGDLCDSVIVAKPK